MSTTQTITQNSSPSTVPLLLQQPPSQGAVYQDALNRLTGILLKYDNWNDPLSQRLFKWGTKVLTIPQEATIGPEIIEKAKERVSKLVNKILVNPLDNAPLKHPVLDADQWVWEEWMLQDHLSMGTDSPFTGQNIATVNRHLFAEEMLTWVHSLPLNANASSTSTDLIASASNATFLNPLVVQQGNPDPQIAVLKLFTYCQLAQTAITTQMLRVNMRQKIKAATAVAAQVWRESRELIRQQTELARQNAAAHQQMIETRIGGIEQTHQSTVNLLHTQIQSTNQQLQNTNVQLQHAQSQCASQDQQIQQLRALYAQKCQEVSGMGKSKKSKNCTIM